MRAWPAQHPEPCRHYGEVGLLPPSRIGSNGYRYYNVDALTRLQQEKNRLDRQRDAMAAWAERELVE